MSTDSHSTIAGRTLRGSIYSLAASGVTITLGFARALVLARLIAPDQFGVLALALFYTTLAAQARSLGFDQALVHRQDADAQVQGVYVVLRLATLLFSTLLLLAATPLLGWLYPGMPLLSAVLVALAGVEVAKAISAMQETWLSKELAFRQLSITDVAASVVMTIVAPVLAWLGWGVWALVAEQASGALTRMALTWLVFRRWSPRPAWHRATAAWFWRYGRPVWGSSVLGFLVDRFDDFWIGTVLGQTPLGYYSRAYEFARYPRRLTANPFVSVFIPVFARLQHDRLRLSQAFYRVCYIVLRAGFVVSGAFALVMPEFIDLVIGPQWRPMLLTFRLMLVYTLLDALLVIAANLLIAIGRPHEVWQVTRAQAIFFIPAVMIGAWLAGIEGVALAADGMLVAGWALLLTSLRRAVDFSLLRLAAWPSIALLLAGAVGLLLENALGGEATWGGAAAKLALFGTVYAAVLLAAERTELLAGARWIAGYLRPGARAL